MKFCGETQSIGAEGKRNKSIMATFTDFNASGVKVVRTEGALKLCRSASEFRTTFKNGLNLIWNANL